MSLRVAISGLGRRGRLALRALLERGACPGRVEVVALVGNESAEQTAAGLRDDSRQRRRPWAVATVQDRSGVSVVVGGVAIRVLEGREDHGMPWQALGVDVVVETGAGARSRESARAHLASGAKQVLLAAPCSDADLTVVMGVNHERLDPGLHRVISCSMPSTHTLAPIVMVLLKEGFGVEEGMLTMLRGGWEGQVLVDGPSRADWRGGRAGGLNLIPSSSGAAKAVGLVLPEVRGRLHGTALRVPHVATSVADFTVRTARPTSYEGLCAAMAKASETYLKGILACTAEPVVSQDWVHCPASCVFDAGAGLAVSDQFLKLVGWCDSDWAYACRLADLLAYIRLR